MQGVVRRKVVQPLISAKTAAPFLGTGSQWLTTWTGRTKWHCANTGRHDLRLSNRKAHANLPNSPRDTHEPPFQGRRRAFQNEDD